ncbi:MAG: hypothetical protein A2086_14720, partial [Spirochaetes bacterium GWD1_27_9]
MKNVIIQGFASNKFLFDDFIANFNDVVVLENNSYTYQEIEQKLNDLSQNDKLNIFGWSLGSLFALKWTVENPDTVLSLFLTGATARFCEKEGYQNKIPQIALQKMIRLIATRKKIVLSDFYNTIFEYTKGKEKYISQLLDSAPDEKNLINGLNELLNLDLLEEVNKIQVPTLICQGQFDKTTPLYNGE